MLHDCCSIGAAVFQHSTFSTTYCYLETRLNKLGSGIAKVQPNVLCTKNVFGREVSFCCYILQSRYQSKEVFLYPLNDYNIDLLAPLLYKITIL